MKSASDVTSSSPKRLAVSRSLPQTWRSQLLHARFIYIAISTTSSVAIIAGISFKVGRLASSPGTTVVAYFLAAVTGLITASYPVHAAIEFLALRKLLHQAEAAKDSA